MKIDREKLKKACEIEIRLHPEDTHPRDHFGYDTKEENDAAVAHVLALAERTEWGWCTVEVRAEFAGMVGNDYLGGCSYESERDFCQPGGYYDDMVDQAVEDLAVKLEKTLNAIELKELAR